MTKYCELLAPAGGEEHLIAAVENGANAVYLGGSCFGARANASNFDDEELERAVDYAHLRGVKVYVTMNTLVEQSQLADAIEYAAFLYRIGVDALIIQDWGLARAAHIAMPDFPIHLSTQGSACNKEGIIAAAGMGFDRVVLARELSLSEIAECAEASDAEIELFVHGAMCICYSGQCHMSRLKGGRSGNKGACAQPCRLPYTRGTEKSHVLSPKDLCLVDDIGQLIAAGVLSLKIEGRMKTPEYVAVVTSIYRKYLDEYYEKGSYEVSEIDKYRLNAIFNRGGFSKGYIYGNPGEELMFPELAKNRGIYIGEVVGIEKRGIVSIKQENESELSLGDGVELRGKNTQTGNVVTYMKKEGKKLLIGDFKGNTEIGARIYRVTDKKLLNEARATYDRPRRTIDINMKLSAYIDEVPVLEVRTTDAKGGPIIVRGDDVVGKAQSKPLTEETVIRQLEKTGDYPFAVKTISVSIEDNAYMPVSHINLLRRRALDILSEKKIKRSKREFVNINTEAVIEESSRVSGMGGEIAETGKTCDVTGLSAPARGLLTIFFNSESDFASFSLPGYLENVNVRYCLPLEVYMKEAFSQRPNVEALPYINAMSRGDEDEYIRSNFQAIADKCRTSGIYIGNVGWIAPFKNAGINVYGGFGLNVTNSAACAALKELGVQSADTSLEVHSEYAAVGAVPVMVTAHNFVSAGKPEELIIRAGGIVAAGCKSTQYKFIEVKDKTIVALDAVPDFKALKTFVENGKSVIAFI
ncbi:MAG: U32 family peptidase [Eubacteriales bacterium]|nr:U32 family peptidase [Eubacteriales bacterium]